MIKRKKAEAHNLISYFYLPHGTAKAKAKSKANELTERILFCESLENLEIKS